MRPGESAAACVRELHAIHAVNGARRDMPDFELVELEADRPESRTTGRAILDAMRNALSAGVGFHGTGIHRCRVCTGVDVLRKSQHVSDSRSKRLLQRASAR